MMVPLRRDRSSAKGFGESVDEDRKIEGGVDFFGGHQAHAIAPVQA
jgi:hypothetical protein